ncbi:MAG: hypothetical protein PHX34_05170 [Candidatus Shapirobacteria bacterium]|nr:hypothetical protein [Candidatus Shapirobacteria bacterium]
MESNYKIGDKIIDFVSIYQITSIDTKNKDVILYYRPIKGTEKVFTASIPEKNLDKANLRKLISSSEIKEILSDLKKPLKNYEYNIRQIKEEIYLNIPQKNIIHLKHLYENENTLQNNEDKKIREELINHLCLEISFVTQKPLIFTRKKIEKILRNKQKIPQVGD